MTIELLHEHITHAENLLKILDKHQPILSKIEARAIVAQLKDRVSPDSLTRVEHAALAANTYYAKQEADRYRVEKMRALEKVRKAHIEERSKNLGVPSSTAGAQGAPVSSTVKLPEDKRGLGLELLQASVREVKAILAEHAALAQQVSQMSAAAKANGTVFWSGQDFTYVGDVRANFSHDAMLSAQALARSIGGNTVETTVAGDALEDLYLFDELKERFKAIYGDMKGDDYIRCILEENERAYTIQQEYYSNLTDEQRENFNRMQRMVTTGPASGPRTSVAMSSIQEAIEAHKSKTRKHLSDLVHEQFVIALGSKGVSASVPESVAIGRSDTALKSAAGTFWDIISQHFSHGADGVVVAVHAVPHSYTSDPESRLRWEKSTFMAVERAGIMNKIRSNSGGRLVQFFLDGVVVVTAMGEHGEETMVLSSYGDYKQRFPDCTLPAPTFVAPDQPRWEKEMSKTPVPGGTTLSGEVDKITGAAMDPAADPMVTRIMKYIDRIKDWSV